jgi:antitoxin (DNA-binding transcriptional repressor) of toxin-antitoxin stability system
MRASQHVRSWEQAVERAERGETVAVLAHDMHVADVVPSGEIERLRETIDILSDDDLLRVLRTGLDDLRAGRVAPASEVAADLRRRST